MKKIYILAAAIVLMALSAISANAQLKGNIFIHDPSTIAECDGKYYTFGTGSGGQVDAHYEPVAIGTGRVSGCA